MLFVAGRQHDPPPPQAHPPKKRHSAALAACIESLEPRTLFSLSVNLPLRTWLINGDANHSNFNDTISIAYNPQTKKLDLTVNGLLRESRDPATLRAIIINAGKGDDTVTVNTAYPTGKTVRTTINGGDGNDTLTGGGEADTINGGNGDDILSGGAGNDTLNGGDGNDSLIGGNGNDTLIGDAGKDRLNGNGGTDTLYSRTGEDTTSGAGADHVINLSQPQLVDAAPPVPVTGDIPAAPVASYTGALRQQLIDQAVAAYSSLLGTTFIHYPPGADPNVLNFQTYGSVSANPSPPTPFTDTLWADANFAYVLQNHQLLITHLSDPAHAQIISRITTDPGAIAGLYLIGDRVVILTTQKVPLPARTPLPDQKDFLISFNGMPVSAYATYQYVTAVATYSLTDPTSPQLVSRSTYTGALASSQVIGNQLYLVLANTLNLPAPVTAPTGNATAPNSSGITYPEYCYQSADQYRAWLENNLDQYLPAYAATAPGTPGATGSLLDNTQYTIPAPLTGNGIQLIPTGIPPSPAFTSVVDIDVADPASGPAAIATAANSTPNVVSSIGQNLYLVSINPQPASLSSILLGGVTLSGNANSQILKFNLGIHSVQFAAAASIPGTVPAPDAINEFNGQLRVISTTSTKSFILSDFIQNGPELALSSSIDGPPGPYGGQFTISNPLLAFSNANGLSLASFSFLGNTADVSVTGATNHSYAIDLSDPVNLVLTEIPAPIAPPANSISVDDTHALSTVFDTASHSIQISLLDTTNPALPVLVDQKTFSNPASTSGFDSFSIPATNGILFAFGLSGPLIKYPGELSLGNSYYAGPAPQWSFLQILPTQGITLLGSTSTPGGITAHITIGPNLALLTPTDLKIINPLHPATPIADIPLT